MTKHEDEMAGFLREVSNWDWDEFLVAEHNPEYTTNEAVIFALIRACVMQKMDAIKLAINRLDGKLKTPIRIEYPKIYYLFPMAALPTGDVVNDSSRLTAPETDGTTVLTGEIMPAPEPPPEEPERDLPSMGFRETLALMSSYPRSTPQLIVDRAFQTHQSMVNKAPRPAPADIPRVKSVVAANLLLMAQSRNMEAINELFDAIDGKLVETIQILGEDIFITDYSRVAPPEAKPNADGVVQMEATATQNLWASKLGKE